MGKNADQIIVVEINIDKTKECRTQILELTFFQSFKLDIQVVFLVIKEEIKK